MSMTGAEFAAHRRLTGLSGEQLAARLGVSSRSVRDWEQGRYQPPEGVQVELRGLVAENRRLALSMVEAGVPVEIPRHGDDDGAGGWWVQAAATAITLEPDLEVDWR